MYRRVKGIPKNGIIIGVSILKIFECIRIKESFDSQNPKISHLCYHVKETEPRTEESNESFLKINHIIPKNV